MGTMNRLKNAVSEVDSFAATGTGNIVALPEPMSLFSIQVKGVGAAPSSWSVTLEGSLDGVHFTTILTHSSGDGSVVSSNTNFKPMLYIRSNCGSLSLGSATSIVSTILGMR